MDCKTVSRNRNVSVRLLNVSLICSANSVTRFGEILPLRWYFKRFRQFNEAYFVLGTVLNLPYQKGYAIRQSFIAVNGQNRKRNLSIWSHWRWANSNCEFSIRHLHKLNKRAIRQFKRFIRAKNSDFNVGTPFLIVILKWPFKTFIEWEAIPSSWQIELAKIEYSN